MLNIPAHAHVGASCDNRDVCERKSLALAMGEHHRLKIVMVKKNAQNVVMDLN